MLSTHGLIRATATLRQSTSKISSSTAIKLPGLQPQQRAMASASTVRLTPSTAGSYHVPTITTQSSERASELLQRNHEKNHLYFGDEGFHNHIVHHLLTIFALGASPDELQKGFEVNDHYQKPPPTPLRKTDKSMADPDTYKEHLGKGDYTRHYLTYFTDEIANKGWKETLLEHLFADTPHAQDLLKRMFGGFYHPIIHLGFGIEFEQPAIIAEALAQAATHDIWIERYIDPLESATQTTTQPSSSSSGKKSLVQLLHESRDNPTLRAAARWSDPNKVRDGVLARAGADMVALASQYRLPASPTQSDLDRGAAEMYHAAIYFTALAQRRGKQRKIDFYYMHCANSAIFFPMLMKLDWISLAKRKQMLEWKIWFDLAMYVSRSCPELLLEEVKSYRPKKENQSWEDIFRRVDGLEDDGHASKLIRALASGQEVCRPYESEGEDVLPIQGGLWLTLANLVIDSVEAPGVNWVRSAGFDQAWRDVPHVDEGGSKL